MNDGFLIDLLVKARFVPIFLESFEIVVDVVPTAQHKVRQGVNKTLADVVAWSLGWAAQGIYPSRGFYGERFDSNMYRSTLSGKQIAGGYKLLEKILFHIISVWDGTQP